jgi:hypothetical protein
MNTNFKNLYTKVYKPIGIEKPFDGEWQHRVLTNDVDSTSRFPGVFHKWSLNQLLPQINTGEKYDK